MKSDSPVRQWLLASPAWIGVIVPAATWVLYQQGLGELVYVACAAGGPPAAPLLGLACAALCAGCGWVAWRGRRRAVTRARQFFCRVGTGMAALFTLGVLAVMAASLVIPPCAR